MAETALSSAMKKAGVNTDAALLRAIAYAELRKVNRDIKRALPSFLEEVRDAPALFMAMIPVEVAKNAAFNYLRSAAEDMKRVPPKGGDGVQGRPTSHSLRGPVDNSRVPAKAGDGVQALVDSHATNGPVEDTSGGGGVQISGALQELCGAAPSPLDVKTGEGGVQRLDDCHRASSAASPVADKAGEDRVHAPHDGQPDAGASSPAANSAGEGVHFTVDSQRSAGPSPAETNAEGGSKNTMIATAALARPSAIPNKPRGLAAMQTARAVDRSILEMRMLSDGTPYGKARWQTLLRRADALLTASISNVREAALMYLTYEHARPPQSNCHVEEVIKPDVARELMRRADRITPEALRRLIRRAAETAETIDV